MNCPEGLQIWSQDERSSLERHSTSALPLPMGRERGTAVPLCFWFKRQYMKIDAIAKKRRWMGAWRNGNLKCLKVYSFDYTWWKLNELGTLAAVKMVHAWWRWMGIIMWNEGMVVPTCSGFTHQVKMVELVWYTCCWKEQRRKVFIDAIEVQKCMHSRTEKQPI